MSSSTQPRELRLAGRAALRIFHAFPARQRDVVFQQDVGGPEVAYADEVNNPSARLFGEPDAWVAGKDVLDLGCGFGGRTVRFAEQGARAVVGVDVPPEFIARAPQFARERAVEVEFVRGPAEAIPLDDAAFDLILMIDVMEHVIDPRAALREVWRVLRPGGALAVTFPPYYALHGGSHLHGYATWLPGLNLVFTTRALKAASLEVMREQGYEPAPPLFREPAPSDKLWNLNGLTVARWGALTREIGFLWSVKRRIGFLDHRLASRTGVRRKLRMPFYVAAELPARIPVLREVFCARIADVLVKPI